MIIDRISDLCFSIKPSILLKDPSRVDRRELEAARSRYQRELDAFVDHCL